MGICGTLEYEGGVMFRSWYKRKTEKSYFLTGVFLAETTAFWTNRNRKSELVKSSTLKILRVTNVNFLQTVSIHDQE